MRKITLIIVLMSACRPATASPAPCEQTECAPALRDIADLDSNTCHVTAGLIRIRAADRLISDDGTVRDTSWNLHCYPEGLECSIAHLDISTMRDGEGLIRPGAATSWPARLVSLDPPRATFQLPTQKLVVGDGTLTFIDNLPNALRENPKVLPCVSVP